MFEINFGHFLQRNPSYGWNVRGLEFFLFRCSHNQGIFFKLPWKILKLPIPYKPTICPIYIDNPMYIGQIYICSTSYSVRISWIYFQDQIIVPQIFYMLNVPKYLVFHNDIENNIWTLNLKQENRNLIIYIDI